MNSIITLLATTLVCLFASNPAPAQAPTAAPPKSLELSFGVYQTDKATEMYRKFTPLLEDLQSRLGQALKLDVDIHLRIFRSYAEGIDALAEGQVDFVRFGPASYILAKDDNPKIQLLVMEEKDGRIRFNGVVFTRKESPIRALKDLRGKSFAFGDRSSTIGRYLAQDQLVQAGIVATDLSKHVFLERHDMVASAVQLGDYDAGSVKESTFKKANKRGDLRVLLTFENVSKPWIARAGLEPWKQLAIREALLTTKDKAALASLKVSGFRAATDEAYDFVRRGIERAREFSPDAER